MSKNCDNIRQLLVELEYGELDAMDATAVRSHLQHCAACSERQAAYHAVRGDLQAWNDIEDSPSRVAFVAMRPEPAPRRSLHGWTRVLATAASFLLGLLLAAAFVNLEVSTSADGWHVSTSLFPRPQQAAEPETRAGGTPATPVGGPRVGSVPVQGATPVQNGGQNGSGMLGGNTMQGTGLAMTEADLEKWLDSRLQARGLRAGGTMPVGTLSPEQLAPILDDLIAEREARLRSLMQDIVLASEQRQRLEVDEALAGLYQTFDAQRANDLVFLAGEMGLLQESTGMELQRTNAAIDYLITRAAQGGARQEPPR